MSLSTFAGQRLLFGGLVLLAIAYLSYFGLDMAEGATIGSALARAARQMGGYLGRVVRGDLGMSVAGSITYAPMPVAEVLPGLLAKSLGLLAISLTFASVVGVLLGVWAARRQHSRWSLVTLLLSIVGISVPSFFVALLLQLLAIRLTRVAGRTLLPVGGFGWDEHLVLPALVLAARPIAQIARLTFVSVGATLDQDYVRTAHSKGLSQYVVMVRHVLRNTAIPILTTIGVSLRFSLSSLPVVEYFFTWTGLGFTLLKAIARRDDNMTVALVLSLGMLFILLNLGLGIAYRLIDPRLRQHDAHGEGGHREGLLAIGWSAISGVWEELAHPPLWQWLRGQKAISEPSPFAALLRQRGLQAGSAAQEHLAQRHRARIRGLMSNLPLVLGLVLVGALLVVVLSGPTWTPHSPYTQRGLEYKDGQLTAPPFAPNASYRWGTDPLGRDILSLIVAGAQQTMLLATLVVAARLALGSLTGVLAGWLADTWVDRSLMGLSEIIAAFPSLLLAMTLILALGIQNGLRPFIVAISLVGWGEIMQLVRGEVMAVRGQPFIESAVATGMRTPRMIWSHVLPNLMPSLISVAALEMGAALMLLGELGFVGIFIGGGAFAEMEVWAAPYHYSDVPEWGALLSNVRLYARAYPWMALYPSLAIFVAILGFNLLGEGIRRAMLQVGIGFSRLGNRYTAALVVVVAAASIWARGHMGSVAYYRRSAAAFGGARAMAYARSLADPSLQGRALGSLGHVLAADRIADWFASVGLQPGGQEMSYFQSRVRAYTRMHSVPRLAVGGDTAWVYRQDYVEYPGMERNTGQFEGPLRVLAAGELTASSGTFGGPLIRVFREADLSREAVLVLSQEDAGYIQQVRAGAMLVVAEDDTELQRVYTSSGRDPTWRAFGTGRAGGQDMPMLWLSQAAADRVLSGIGQAVADLRLQAEQLGPDEVMELATHRLVSVGVEGVVSDRVLVRHVIGHWPGLSDSNLGGLNTQTIVVLAQYDTPPRGPDGVYSAGANDNASGVAVMIEAVRAMQETGYQPYRTFLFIAYSGEGLEGGERVNPSDVSQFLAAHYGFAASLKVEAIVHLRGLGAGDGDALLYSAIGSRRLARLLERSARQMGVRARAADETVDLSIVFEEKSVREGGQEAAEIGLSWAGWDALSRRPEDVTERLSADTLERAGKVLALALMTMGRELDY